MTLFINFFFSFNDEQFEYDQLFPLEDKSDPSKPKKPIKDFNNRFNSMWKI